MTVWLSDRCRRAWKRRTVPGLGPLRLGVLGILALGWVGLAGAIDAPALLAQAPLLVRPDLELGVQDPAVAELQAVLWLLGFYGGEVSGSYSEETSQAVARFQDAAGLPMTGRVDRSTWDRLFPPPTGAIATQPTAPAQPAIPEPILSTDPAAPASRPQPSAEASPGAEVAPEADPDDPFPILRQGAQGDAVARLQELLQRQGTFAGVVDGDFGPLTLEAVIAAQEQLGLEPDGVVGPATWNALGQ